jgi:archaellum component FlaC
MASTDDLKKELDELKDLIKSRPSDLEASRDNNNKWMGWIRNLVAVVAVLIGLGVNWGVTKTKIEVQEAYIAALDERVTERINKMDADIHELQLKQAGYDQLLQTIKEDVAEIKKDVKSIADRRR